MVTQLLVKPQRTEALSYSDRATIASVLTWDSINGTFNPDDIETICLKGDIVWVKLTNGKKAPAWVKRVEQLKEPF